MLVTTLWHYPAAQLCLALLLTTVQGQVVRNYCRRAGVFRLNGQDQRATTGVISTKKVPSLMLCNNFCLTVSNCASINFEYQTTSATGHSCELVGESSPSDEEEGVFETRVGWNHYKPIAEIASICKIDSCPVGYRCEETCQQQKGFKCVYINYCLSSPCENGATCIDVVNNFTCTCAVGYEGAYCEKDIDHCLSSPCKNGATCNDGVGSFTCLCTQGYEGTLCDKVQACTSECTSPVCSNLGAGVKFTTEGRTGRVGNVLSYTIPSNGDYQIKAAGAKGGTHNTTEGNYPGTFCGGNGATMQGVFSLTAGTVLKIVVGHRGGDSVEISGGQLTTSTAASLGKSIEDHAGTGGGGGSFVYTSENVLLVAAGGGGGGTAGWNGVAGSNKTNGTRSVGKTEDQRGTGGQDGKAGQCCAAGSYPGGTGAGWIEQGLPRASADHGERGGSRAQNWIGGHAGTMNSGNNGGPAPGAVGGFGGGGGGSEDNGASGGGGGYSGGGSGTHSNQAGGGGGSFCNSTIGSTCVGVTGGNGNHYGYVTVYKLP
eukprot:gene5223-5879_t